MQGKFATLKHSLGINSNNYLVELFIISLSGITIIPIIKECFNSKLRKTGRTDQIYLVKSKINYQLTIYLLFINQTSIYSN